MQRNQITKRYFLQVKDEDGDNHIIGQSDSFDEMVALRHREASKYFNDRIVDTQKGQ